MTGAGDNDNIWSCSKATSIKFCKSMLLLVDNKHGGLGKGARGLEVLHTENQSQHSDKK